MKKIFLGIISFILVLGFIGCGKPEISQNVTNGAIQEMNKYPEVAESAVQIKDNAIYLAIAVKDASITQDKAYELADSFARLLSSKASMENKDIAMPNKDSLGGIYEDYDLNICVGTGNNNIMYQGAKVAGASKITWAK